MLGVTNNHPTLTMDQADFQQIPVCLAPGSFTLDLSTQVDNKSACVANWYNSDPDTGTADINSLQSHESLVGPYDFYPLRLPVSVGSNTALASSQNVLLWSLHQPPPLIHSEGDLATSLSVVPDSLLAQTLPEYHYPLRLCDPLLSGPQSSERRFDNNLKNIAIRKAGGRPPNRCIKCRTLRKKVYIRTWMQELDKLILK